MNQRFYNILFKLYILFIAFSFAYSKNSISQIYYPFPKDSAFWDVEYGGFDFGNYTCDYTAHYGMMGDTIIDSVDYSKIYVNKIDSFFNLSNASYYCALREDSSKRIWVRRASDSADVLLYDFSLQVGDTFCFDFSGFLSSWGCHQVEKIDSILIDGVFRKQIHIIVDARQTWIEGIGNIYGLFEIQIVGSGPLTTLNCFTVNNALKYPSNSFSCHCDNFTGIENIYRISDLIKIYPNPLTSMTTLYIKPLLLERIDRVSFLLYDLYGSEVKYIEENKSEKTIIKRDNLPNGIYFYKISSGNIVLQRGKLILN